MGFSVWVGVVVGVAVAEPPRPATAPALAASRCASASFSASSSSCDELERDVTTLDCAASFHGKDNTRHNEAKTCRRLSSVGVL